MFTACFSPQCLGPFAFYDVKGLEEVPDNSSSLVNKTEAEMVMSLFLALVQRYPQLRASSSIAVISPYKAQVMVFPYSLKPNPSTSPEPETLNPFYRSCDTAVQRRSGMLLSIACAVCKEGFAYQCSRSIARIVLVT